MGLSSDVYVSGMPLFLRGWNGLYRRTDVEKWELVNHIYYGIGIIHTTITKNKHGRWVLKTDDFQFTDNKYCGSDGPCGDWGDIYVSKTQNLSTWYRSNSSLMWGFVALMGILALYKSL